MKSMLEREKQFTPVTASVVDRHVLAKGSQEKVVNNITRKDKEKKPDLIVLTPTCTSSILQEDLNNFVETATLESKADVILADVNHYRVNELQAADKTLLQITSFYLNKAKEANLLYAEKTLHPSVNIIGNVSLGFHNQHDLAEIKRIMADLNIQVNVVLPEGSSIYDLNNIPRAWFNIIPYREIGLMTAEYLKQEFNMPFLDIIPMGILQINDFIRKVQGIITEFGRNVNYDNYIDRQIKFISQSSWFSRSIDCQNLVGKKAVVFGDTTHAVAITKILVQEMNIKVLWSGTYCIHDSSWFNQQVSNYCNEVLITDDHTLVADLIAKTEPDAIFGTQMERHIGKRLNIPCAVVSSPVHIQNFPLSYRPFMGYEGTNQIADLVYNSFTLGMEDHLLEVFGGHDIKKKLVDDNDENFVWLDEAKEELSKIPGFVRNKVKKNTEKFACDNHIFRITLQTIYDAKQQMQ